LAQNETKGNDFVHCLLLTSYSMSGIYIHIPFCKQACHYCDFHFSTNLKKKEAMVRAIKKELVMRSHECKGEAIHTIYFGGGTPSLLTIGESDQLLGSVRANYKVVQTPEVTLEANPDDLTPEQITKLAEGPVNRLSIGVQSFFDSDLRLMNRAHNALEARACIEMATGHFDNISIDLIYGVPGMDSTRWQQNIEEALSFNIPHISAYALTVEPKTALKKYMDEGIVPGVDDKAAGEQFHWMTARLEREGFVHYEISNFGKPGYFSRNNTAYWQGKKYVGIGPSAHSYDGRRRGWNVRNNLKYLKAIGEGKIPMEVEELSKKDRYNEYVMMGLRTIWGLPLDSIASEFGEMYHKYLLLQAEKYLQQGLLHIDNGTLLATKKGKFLIDGIAADLFLLNLKESLE